MRNKKSVQAVGEHPIGLRKAQRKKRRSLRIVLISAASVLALIIGVVVVYGVSLSQQFDSSERIENAFPEEQNRPERLEGEAAKAMNILLLGSDTRGSLDSSLESASGRADTMMVVHISADRKSVQVMSIMRDSWVQIPGRGEAKANAAMAYGGVALAVEMVETLITARIDHVAIVDFAGFKGITDALGGVTVDNAKAFNAESFSFAQGPITLNGEQALVFVRERMAFRDGDFQRVKNQQAFIKALMNKTLSRETMTNPVSISNLVSALAPFVAVDEDFTSAFAASLAFEAREVRGDNVTFFTMPTLGTGRVGNQSVVLVNFPELAVVADHFRTDTLDSYVPLP